MEKLTIDELIDAYDNIMRVFTSGTPLYQSAESARYYLQQLLHYQKLDASFDHIRDLVEAERGGRLVVLPCKVGDPVYTVQQVGRGHWEDDKYILDDRGTPKVYEKKFSLILLEYIGKTVFLTREEAERELHDVKSELSAAASEYEQEI